MSRLKRRARNSQTFAVRDGMLTRAGGFGDTDLSTEEQRATHLVIECGDLLLELLVTTATELLDRANRQHRKRDTAALTAALGDPARVERAWTILTRGIAESMLAAAQEADFKAGVSAHQRAVALLAAHFPLSEEDEEALRTAPQAEKLGYYSPEVVLTTSAFTALLGDGGEDLALFADFEPFFDIPLLQRAFEVAIERYTQLLAAGVAEGPHG